MSYSTSPCKYCGAPMVWTRTEANSKPMPLDPEPVPEGTFAIILPLDGGRDRRSVHRTKADAYGAEAGPFYVPHWATCPHANKARR